MKIWLFRLIQCSLLLLLSHTLVFAAEEEQKPGACEVDEIDMGDYCASLPPAITEEDKSRRRITRFRGKSMMPGRTEGDSATPEEDAKPLPGKQVTTNPGLPVTPLPVTPSTAAEPQKNLPLAESEVTAPPPELAPPVEEPAQQVEPVIAVPKPVTPPVPVSAGSGYVVQLGAFSSRSVAVSVAQNVHAEGIPVALAPIETASGVLWACFAGPYEDMEQAKSARDHMRLKREFAAAWVKPVGQLSLTGLNNEAIEE